MISSTGTNSKDKNILMKRLLTAITLSLLAGLVLTTCSKFGTGSDPGNENGNTKGAERYKASNRMPTALNAKAQFIKTIGGSRDDDGWEVLSTSDGGVLVAGETKSSDGDFSGAGKGDSDIFISKIDDRGKKEWLKTYGGSRLDRGWAIAKVSGGEYVLMGITRSNDGDFNQQNNGRSDIFALKFDGNGNKRWLKTFGGSRYEFGESIVATSDGGVILSGDTNSNDGDFTGSGIHGNSLDIFALKIDASGNKVWVNTYGGSRYDKGYNIIRSGDGGYILTGESYSNDGDFTQNRGSADLVALKIDGTGKKQWLKTFGGSGPEWGIDLFATNDRGYILTGFSYSKDGDLAGLNKGIADVIALKIDAQGNKEWLKTYGGSRREFANSITSTGKGEYILMGYTYSNDGDFSGMNHGATDLCAIKIDESGNYEWIKTFGGSGDDNGNRMDYTHNSKYILIGDSNSNDGDFKGLNNGGKDAFLLQLNEAGKLIPFPH